MATDYWNSELRRRGRLLDDSINVLDAELAKRFKVYRQRIIKEMRSVYTDVMQDAAQGFIQPQDLYRYGRYYELQKSLEKEITELSAFQEKKLEEKLEKLYLENAEMVGKYMGVGAVVDVDDARKALYTIWCADGRSWSQRIWRNNRELKARLLDGLVEAIATGKSIRELEVELMNFQLSDLQIMGTAIVKNGEMVTLEQLKAIDQTATEALDRAWKNAERLVKTEMSHISVQSSLDEYQKAGITHYRYCARKEEMLACDICRDLNGKIFPIAEASAGVNLPPMHPNCKCSTRPVFKTGDSI